MLLDHLRIFRHRAFPLDPRALVSLVDHDDRRVASAALRALSMVSHESIRVLAFQLAKTKSEWRGRAVSLLDRNFDAGDHEIVLGWWEGERDPHILHDLEMDLLNFWERHGHEDTFVRMLLSVYEKGPCSFCRESVVRRLIGSNALPEELRTECAFDANEDIRELVNLPEDPARPEVRGSDAQSEDPSDAQSS